MASIKVKFDHPPVSLPDRALALVTIVGTTLANAPVAAGQTRKWNIPPGTYDITVAVTTRATTAWTIIVTPEGGAPLSEPGTGVDSVFFPAVEVASAAMTVRALSLTSVVADLLPTGTESTEQPTTNINLKLTVPVGTKWSATLSCDGETILADTSEIEETDFEDEEPDELTA